MTGDAVRRCGYVAIVGRPNVGKSTLLNHLLNTKLSITSRKPQTTRHSIMGIKTEGETQFIFVDTPGIHRAGKKALNRQLNRTAFTVLKDVDVVVFVLDRTAWLDEDEMVARELRNLECPVIVVLNKIDLVKDKSQLLPAIAAISQQVPAAAIIPVSALRNNGTEMLEQEIARHLPTGDFIFPEDEITDRSERFVASEMIREKIIRQLGEELPYETAVEIEQFADSEKLLRISAVIHVEKAGQKKIIIGDGGDRLRKIGSDARKDLEKFFAKKVMLELWVKVRRGWSDSEKHLRDLGYTS